MEIILKLGEGVSRKHFELQRNIYWRNIYWNICDTSNDSIGTFVNGSRITKGRPVSKYRLFDLPAKEVDIAINQFLPLLFRTERPRCDIVGEPH